MLTVNHVSKRRSSPSASTRAAPGHLNYPEVSNFRSHFVCVFDSFMLTLPTNTLCHGFFIFSLISQWFLVELVLVFFKRIPNTSDEARRHKKLLKGERET